MNVMTKVKGNAFFLSIHNSIVDTTPNYLDNTIQEKKTHCTKCFYITPI